jgi:hypothetical protein
MAGVYSALCLGVGRRQETHVLKRQDTKMASPPTPPVAL